MSAITECPKCGTKYSTEKLVGQVQIRCKVCSGVFSSTGGGGGGSQAALATQLAREDAGPSLAEGKMIALAVMDGPMRGKIFRITTPRVVIGRTGSDIVIDDPEVSRKHCAIEVNGTSAVLVDLDTTNGTYVNGKRIQKHRLQHLSEFRIGSNTFMFSVTDKHN
jgi:FHA domain